jgi:hypothetical protein
MPVLLGPCHYSLILYLKDVFFGLAVTCRQSCPGQSENLTFVIVDYKIDLGE